MRLRPAVLPISFAIACTIALVAPPARAQVVPEDGTWSLTYLPKGRGYASVIHDTRRDRLVVYGGLGGLSSGIAYTEVWTMPLAGPPVWTHLAVAGAPPSSRYGQAAIYDPLRDRMIVYSGATANGGYYLGDVWELTFDPVPTWREITPDGPRPWPRYLMAAAYDPVRDRLVIAGGVGAEDGYTNAGYLTDAWALSLGDDPRWTQLPAVLDGPRAFWSGIYDPLRDRLIAFGGSTDLTHRYNDLHALPLADAATWTVLPALTTAPSARDDAAVAYDSARDAVIVCAGYASTHSTNDTWEYSLADSTWTQRGLNGTAPRNRYSHGGFYDAARDHLVIFGGMTGRSPTNVGILNEVHVLDLSNYDSWSPMNPPAPPSGRSNVAAAWDADHRTGWVIGGEEGEAVYGDVWTLSLERETAWSPIVASGTGPTARAGASAVVDTRRDRLILFGGLTSGSFHSAANDAWALSLLRGHMWAELDVAGPKPPPRFGHGAVYDRVTDRVILFGGSPSSGAPFGDVWMLTLRGAPAWTEVVPSTPGPAPRFGHGCVLDAARRRMIITCGADQNQLFNDTWALSLTPPYAWTRLGGDSLLPARRDASVALDAERDRLVAYGGTTSLTDDSQGALDDTWVLPLGVDAGSTGWRRLAPAGTAPTARRGAASFFDDAADRFVVFGGARVDAMSDTWMLQWPPVKRRPYRASSPPDAPQVVTVRPAPATGPFTVQVSLSMEADVRMELVDVRGRIVWRHDTPDAHAGPMEEIVTPPIGVPAGVYVLCVVQGDRMATHTIALMGMPR